MDAKFILYFPLITSKQLSTHEVVEVRAKLLYQVELQRASLDQMWGFSVEAELVENADRQDELCCYVSRVEERSVAMNNGKLKKPCDRKSCGCTVCSRVPFCLCFLYLTKLYLNLCNNLTSPQFV
jgi:hypothetical protein